MDNELKEIVRILNQPHRVTNMLALFRTCEKAAALLQAQAAKIEELDGAAPAVTPKRARRSGAGD